MTDEQDSGNPDNLSPEETVTRIRAESTRRRLPKQIGNFHIKDVIAAGGMGVVYRAVQEQPRRTVAVKVMRHGIASRSAMRRFEYESQILARLHHPGIAQVFEAGTHDDGDGTVPYFAMEYIPNAKPITQFAKEKSLGTPERLELFAKVCDAVQHGHQKGIIHRDLKPDNILVNPHGEVKIIDFGVARGTDSDLAVTTLQTDIGQLIGTLQYMSPEQCEADPGAIDARSDVYALGVVLYELLTGRLPYAISGKHVLHSTGVIRKKTPIKPSTIDRTLRGDLETIVLTALEKDPDRRYTSATDFERDIHAYLNGEAIHARPPSAVYQVSLFARRYKVRLGSVAAVILIATIATILVVRSHDRAEKAVIAAEASMKVGSSENENATDMVGRIPAEFSITTVAGESVGTAGFASYKATVLNFVAADCPYCFKQVPLVEKIRAEYEPQGVRFVNIAETLFQDFTAQEASDIFARYGSRVELARDETETIGDLFKVSGYPTLSILDNSGMVKHVTIGAAGDLMTLLRGELDALILGIPSPDQMLADAEKLHRQTLENNRRTLGEGHRDTLQSMENLAVTLRGQDKHEEAEELYREIWNIRSRFLGESDPRTLESIHQLAVVLHQRRKPAEAEALHRRNLATRQRVLGEDHPETRLSMAHLGMSLQSQGKTDGIEPYIVELIELRRRAAQEQDANANTLNKYAWLLLNCEPAQLRDPFTALETAKSSVELSGRQVTNLLETLALAQKMTGDLPAAIETQKEALRLILPGNFLDRMPLEKTLAEYYQEAGNVGAMEEWYRDSLTQTRAFMPARSLAVSFTLATLGRFLLEQERYSEAEPVFREVLDITRVALPHDHWIIFNTESTLGQSLIGQAQFEEAERLVVNSYTRMKDDNFVPADVLTLALERVIKLYTAWGKPEEAARFREMTLPNEAAKEPGA